MAKERCAGCTKTGGRGRPVLRADGTTAYEVRIGDVAVERFSSAIAAATYARGRVGATVHRATP